MTPRPTIFLPSALVERGAVDVQPELTEASRLLYFRGPNSKLYTAFGIGFPIFAAPLYVVGRGLGNLAQSVSPRLAGLGPFLPRVMIALGNCCGRAVRFWHLYLGVQQARLRRYSSYFLPVAPGGIYRLMSCSPKWPRRFQYGAWASPRTWPRWLLSCSATTLAISTAAR